MAQMPVPISRAPPAKRRQPKRAPPAMPMAHPEVSMATPSETKVVVTLYRSTMGSEKAIMPMKCIDQMPMPMAIAPPTRQNQTCTGLAFATRAASDSAVYETSTATAMESATRDGL